MQDGSTEPEICGTRRPVRNQNKRLNGLDYNHKSFVSGLFPLHPGRTEKTRRSREVTWVLRGTLRGVKVPVYFFELSWKRHQLSLRSLAHKTQVRWGTFLRTILFYPVRITPTGPRLTPHFSRPVHGDCGEGVYGRRGGVASRAPRT